MAFFAAVFLAAVFFAAVFLAGAFFAAVFLAAVFLAAVFLAGAFFAAVFLAGAAPVTSVPDGSPLSAGSELVVFVAATNAPSQPVA